MSELEYLPSPPTFSFLSSLFPIEVEAEGVVAQAKDAVLLSLQASVSSTPSPPPPPFFSGVSID